jgi:cyanophycinase-like exopeptidase
VCVDQDGNAKVFGANKAYFIMTSTMPETCMANTPLTWDQHDQALNVYIFQASPTGTPAFNLKSWPTSTPHEHWFVENGELKKIQH